MDDPSASWNCQSGRPAAVKGALSAALYPQVACMDSETTATKRPAWLANDLSVSVHPSSVLHPLLSPQYFSPFVLFSEKMQTSSVYMRDISVVPAIALVMFGGHIEVHHDSGYILLDSWLKVLLSLLCCYHWEHLASTTGLRVPHLSSIAKSAGKDSHHLVMVLLCHSNDVDVACSWIVLLGVSPSTFLFGRKDHTYRLLLSRIFPPGPKHSIPMYFL